MYPFKTYVKFAAFGALVFGASLASAQDSKALVDALAKNGVITTEQAALILKDIVQTPTPPSKTAVATVVSTAKGKYLESLQLYGFMQQQFYTGATSVNGMATDPNFYTNRFFLRRMYVGLKASLGDGFTGSLFYDFAGSFFEQAYIEWKQSDLLLLSAGQRKVPFAYDETMSSRELKAIERSPVTNYFVNSPNNRRLSSGSLRQGMFASGSLSDWFYTVAITNPDRAEFATGGGTPAAADQRVTAKTNSFAYWARVGYGGKFGGGTYKLGVDGGYLGEQGGNATAKTTGDVAVYSMFADINAGAFNFQGAYFLADVKRGAVSGLDAQPRGYWLQPSYKLGNWEGVIRYTLLDTDGRGVDMADGVRAAPGGGTMDKLTEWYFGGTLFLRGNDVKLQAGYIRAETKDTPLGGPAKATSNGLRTQLQLNF